MSDYYEDDEDYDFAEETSDEKIEGLNDRIDELEEKIQNMEKRDNFGCFNSIWLLGSILATVMSWETNHSIGWAFLHGISSWGYIIYKAFNGI